MTNAHHTTESIEPGAAELLDAAEQVVCLLTGHMSLKKERKARAEIDAFIHHLETHKGRHLPGANVVPIRGDVNASDRLNRLRLAAAVRLVAGPVAAPVLS